MNQEWEDLVRQLQRLVNRAYYCKDAREVLGQNLTDARIILDRMQWLIDEQYISTGRSR